MASIEQLDLLLGEALENIARAADEIHALEFHDAKVHLEHIGHAIMELWDIRDSLYSIRPDIRRDFVTESRSDPPRFEKLSELSQKAGVAEQGGDDVSAQAFYLELRNCSPYGWFKLRAEAGLYRTSEQGKAQQTNAPYSDPAARSQKR